MPRSFKARPTTDFAKENLFNVLGNLIDLDGAKALDLFAGTGSIGFEMLSRGCGEVTTVEKDGAHHAFIKKVKAELGDDRLTAIRADAVRFLETNAAQYDLIFADPPFAFRDLARIPELVLSRGLLREEGVFVMEHPKEYDFSALPLFAQRRAYGAVNFSLFIRSKD